LRNGVINDTVAGAVASSGIATTRSGKWVLAFGDRGVRMNSASITPLAADGGLDIEGLNKIFDRNIRLFLGVCGGISG